MHSIELVYKKKNDFLSKRVQKRINEELNLNLKIKVGKLFIIDLDLNDDELIKIKDILIDSILQDFYIDSFFDDKDYSDYILISKLPGVTDDESISLQEIMQDLFEKEIEGKKVFIEDIYYVDFGQNLSIGQGTAMPLHDLDILGKISKRFANPLIHKYIFGKKLDKIDYIPKVEISLDKKVEFIDINISDKKLLELSKNRVLALNLEEMLAIKSHFLDKDVITDCELEILAQTWSEHCKHKEFNANIHYINRKTGEDFIINSLFDTYIKGSTEIIEKKLGKNSYLVKVFSDNAGVVKFTSPDKDNRLFLWKVETHNSPSAIDPYGGAMTGILGNNRDALGVGKGGAKILFNTDILCFGPLNYNKKLLSRQHHPKDIFKGVVQGIKDGGNKSGIPTINGSIIFDERYSGKPLVFCGTGSIMDMTVENGARPIEHKISKGPTLVRENKKTPSWSKEIDNGDLIFMVGGRVGKDGIHGATFSSIKLDKTSPTSAVQIGSPITQKKISDFLEIVSKKGYVKAITDNGAGGLSSSVGELATISNGAKVFIEMIPLKYPQLKPWEIFVSESQERMTLVVDPKYREIITSIAKKMSVEATEIGIFTNSGYLEVLFENKHIAYLDLEFLHNGVPKKYLEAIYEEPNLEEPNLEELLNFSKLDIEYFLKEEASISSLQTLITKLFASYNICSKESVIREYDHEVKGKTILKPLMGEFLEAPQDAAVIRIDFDSYQGIAVSNGIMPKFGDLDAYQMACGAFDEAMRSIISVGGKLTEFDSNFDGIYNFWSVNDNFAVPNSAFDEKNNPDGREKLAKVVQINQALYDMSTFFNIPMTSGKDSMKNDFVSDGVKISAPHTILFSMAHKIDDVRKMISSDFKSKGDLIYQINNTYDELGGSEFYKLFNKLGKNVPIVRKKRAFDIYKKTMKLHKLNILESSHDISDGGMIIALIESSFGTRFGIDIDINSIIKSLNNLKYIKKLIVSLFSESHTRFIVSIKPKNRKIFEQIMGKKAFYLGIVTLDNKVIVKNNKNIILSCDKNIFLDSWKSSI